MAVNVRIPAVLRPCTDGLEVVPVLPGTLRTALTELVSRYPASKTRLMDDFGTVRKFVNIYVNGEDVRFLKQEETPLADGDEVSIIPAIAGG